MEEIEKLFKKHLSRREFGTSLILQALALSIPTILLPASQAQANPWLIFRACLRLIPLFSRNIIRRAVRSGITRGVTRTALRSTAVRGSAIGASSLLSTAVDAYAAYDIIQMARMFSQPVQDAVNNYEYNINEGGKPLTMIWNADESNDFIIKGRNFSDRDITDQIILVLYDVNKEQDIVSTPLGGITIEAGREFTLPKKTITRLPRSLVAGDLIVMDMFLPKSTNEVAIESSNVICVEREM